MKSCSYGTIDSEKSFGLDFCNRKSEELPLTVNCAGYYCAKSEFSTDKVEGRLDWYLLIVTKGELCVRLPDCDVSASVGDAVVFPPRLRYCYAGSAKKQTEYLWVHFTGSFVSNVLADFGIGANEPTIFKVKVLTEVKRLFERLFDSIVPRDGIMQHRLGAILYDIIVLTCGEASAEDKGTQKPLSKSIHYIHNTFDSRITVPDLAKMENLSVSRYNTLFRNVTGTNPTGYILNLRIHTACDLLQNTDLSVSRVASAIGYEDTRLFGKLFKREVGVTPSEYRRSRP